MKLSVVIPTLNEEKYVGNLLNCLANQDFKDFEVLVVDADSKDKTEEEVLKFKDKLNICFIKSPKRGVAFQRNYGAKKAKNEFIVFFDADLKMESRFLSKLVKVLKKRNPSMVTSYFKPQSNKLIHYILMGFYNTYTELAQLFDPIATGAFICVNKKHFLEVGGFSEEVLIYEDSYLARVMHKKGYKYTLLRFPAPEFSMRRIEKMGLKQYLKESRKAVIAYLEEGKVSKNKDIDYKFGEF